MTFSKYNTKITKKIFRRLTTLSLLLSFVIPNVASASPYGGSTYSKCVYSQGCPPASSGSGGSSSSSSNGGTSGIILLNDFDAYFSDSGKQLTLAKNQVVYFDVTTLGQTVRYKLTVTAVGSNYIDFTITPGSLQDRLNIGETKQYDVNDDGQNDIAITLDGINSSGKALITFKSISASTITPVPATQNNPVEPTQNNFWLLIASASAVALGMLIFIIAALKRRKREREESIFATSNNISQYKSPY